jgi:hypothetical protein
MDMVKMLRLVLERGVKAVDNVTGGPAAQNLT